MQKLFEEYGGVVHIAMGALALILIAGIIVGGANGGVIGESLQNILNQSAESNNTSSIVVQKSNNIMAPLEDLGDKEPSYWACDATLVDFDSTYDNNLEIVDVVDDLWDETTGELIPGRAVDLSTAGDGSVVAFMEQKGEEIQLTLAGKNGVIMAPEDCTNMFSGFSSLKQIGFDKCFNTSNVTSMTGMFRNCSDLVSVDLSSFNTSNVTDMSYMFYNCGNLKKANLSSFDGSKVTGMRAMFYSCKSLETLDMSKFVTSEVLNTTQQMFTNCSALETLNLSKFNTEGVTTMMQMFQGCTNLKNLDISSFSGKSVKQMTRMFANCKGLTSLDLSNLKPESLTAIAFMFTGCENLTEVDLSGFNTSGVASFASLFSGCSALKKLDLSGFNTEKATTFSQMFNNCSSLEELDISSFKPTKVTTANKMFYNCSSLNEVKIGLSWDISSATNKTDWLTGCSLVIPEKYDGSLVIANAA